MDFSEIKGQEAAKRAALVALAGDHSIVFIGPKGHGKTMLCEAIKGIGDIETAEIDVDLIANHERDSRIAGYARFDIHVEVPAVPFREIVSKRTGTDSESMRGGIENMGDERPDSDPSKLSSECMSLLKQAHSELGMSTQAVFVVCDIAATIAQLDGNKEICPEHLAEAIQYRLIDRRA